MNTLVHPASILSGRSAVMVVTVGLHAAVIAALMAARMDIGFTEPTVPRLQVALSKSEPVIAKPDLVSVPIVALGKATMPADLPEVAFDPPQAGPIDFDPITSDPDSSPGPVSTEQSVPNSELRHFAVRATDEFYPEASIRLEEQGTSIVRVCVDAAGRVVGKPVIATTSGYGRLDAAAVQWAREALRFEPATRGGAPVEACKRFRVRFNLH
jgi:TonB family protein